jgi:RNA polymerase sigma-70 factor (ECF subfamily)
MVMTMMEIDDNILVQECREGNLRKFQVLVERYKKPMYFFALGMVGNPDDAFDLSQEAFIKAYRSLKRFDSRFPFKSWLFAILSNLCKNALRSAGIRQKYLAPEEALITAKASDDVNPEKVLADKRIKEAIWKALATLDNDAREIIILKHFQDMSYKEIAEVLDIPLGSVMSRLHYARLKLKNALAGVLE